jgi:tetratricopeptide (TPR) repeat protein
LPEAHRHLSADDLLSEGFIAKRKELWKLATAYFQTVVRRQPDNPYALLELGGLYFKLFEFDRGNRALRAATLLGDGDPEILTLAGQAYAEARLDREAERCLSLARSHSGGNQAATARLLAFYETLGMVAPAEALLERLGRKGVRSPLIATINGILLSHTGKNAQAIELLRASLPELPAQSQDQIRGRYALARALAETGKEAACLTELRCAKELQEQQPHVSVLREQSIALADAVAEARDAVRRSDIRSSWRAAAGPSPQPLLFLLGYPRSGTTLLEQVLETHPAIHGMEELDLLPSAIMDLPDATPRTEHTLWNAFQKASPAALQRARASYFKFAANAGAPQDPSRVLLDKNPSLTWRAHFIARMFPDAKLLVMLRDPRDVCISAYQTFVGLTPFSVNWLRWPDTMKHCANVLQHWVDIRDRLPNPYLEVRYEDLIADLPGTGRRVMEFIGLDWQPQQEDFAAHARAKQVYSPTLYQVRQGLTQNARGKWRRFGLDYRLAETGMDKLLKEFGYEPG